MAYIAPTATAGVLLTTVNPALLAAGTENSYYGISFLTLKGAANESINADGFQLTGSLGTLGNFANLYVNTGSVTTPNYVSIAAAATKAGLATTNVVMRNTGIYIENTLISGSDSKLYFLPAANANGAQSFTVRAIDNMNGIWGDAGDIVSQTDVAVTVNFTAVNTAPVVTMTALTAATEGVALNLINSGLTVTDVDGANGNMATAATVTLTVSEGVLNAAAGNSAVTVISGNGTGTLVLSGTALNLNSFLTGGTTGTLTFLDSNPIPAANVTLSMVANDTLIGSVAVPNAILAITPVNNAPVNTVPGAQAVVANAAAITGISVADADTAVVQTTLAVDVGALTLGALDPGVTIVAGANGTATVTLSGTTAAITPRWQTVGLESLTRVQAVP